MPQAYLDQLPRGYVNPASWDPGVTAGMLNYNLNTYRTDSNGTAQTSTYLGLDAGLNLGPWHLRQHSTVTWQSGSYGAPPGGIAGTTSPPMRNATFPRCDRN